MIVPWLRSMNSTINVFAFNTTISSFHSRKLRISAGVWQNVCSSVSSRLPILDPGTRFQPQRDLPHVRVVGKRCTRGLGCALLQHTGWWYWCRETRGKDREEGVQVIRQRMNFFFVLLTCEAARNKCFHQELFYLWARIHNELALGTKRNDKPCSCWKTCW